jgi:hypothetical protein
LFLGKPYQVIQARTADGQPLCRALAANDGHFRCEGFVSTEAAVPVILEARGFWGEASLSGSIPAGNLISAGVYKRDLEVNATTLHFTGRLLDPTGQPPFQGRVRVSGSEIGQTEVMTDSLPPQTVRVSRSIGKPETMRTILATTWLRKPWRLMSMPI